MQNVCEGIVLETGEAHLREVLWLKECAVRNSSVVFLSCSSSLPCCCSDSCTVDDTSTTCSSAGKAAQNLPKWAGAAVEWQAQPLCAPGLERNV